MSINNNFYTVVNSLVSQGTGSNITVTDHASFIDFGKTLDGINGTEIANNFLSTLANRITEVVELYRGYTGDYADLYRGNIIYGQTIEQIMYNWYESNAAGWTQLNDGETFGTYTISKPQIKVNFFEKENAYDIEKTIQLEMLKKAFTSETEMNSFMSGIFGMFTNSNEYVRETARINMITGMIAYSFAAHTKKNIPPAMTANTLNNIYDLRRGYATDTGDTTLNSKTTEVLLNNEKFVKYSTATIKKIKEKMAKRSKAFSISGEIDTFTPLNSQNTYISAGLKSAIDTYIINTAHYPGGADVLNLNAKPVSYWQSAEAPYKIDATIPESVQMPEMTSIKKGDILGVVFDDWACGEYTSVQTMDISPYDAKKRCWQYIFHGLCRYVSNVDANFVIFYVSDPSTNG